MIATVAADRIIDVKMKPCSSAKPPSIQVSDCWNAVIRNGDARGPASVDHARVDAHPPATASVIV